MKRKDISEKTAGEGIYTTESVLQISSPSDDMLQIVHPLPFSQTVMSADDSLQPLLDNNVEKSVPELTKKPRLLTQTPFTFHNSFKKVLDIKCINKNIRDSKYSEKDYAVSCSSNIGKIIPFSIDFITITSHPDVIRAWKTIDNAQIDKSPLWTFSVLRHFYSQKLWVINQTAICVGYDYNNKKERITIIYKLNIFTGEPLSFLQSKKIIPETITVNANVLIFKLLTGQIININLNLLNNNLILDVIRVSMNQAEKINNDEDVMKLIGMKDEIKSNDIKEMIILKKLINSDLKPIYEDLNPADFEILKNDNFINVISIPIPPSKMGTYTDLFVTKQKIIDIVSVLNDKKSTSTYITITNRDDTKKFTTIFTHQPIYVAILTNHLLICRYGDYSNYLIIDINQEKIILDNNKDHCTSQVKQQIVGPLYQYIFDHHPREKILDLITNDNKIAVVYTTEYSGKLHSSIRIRILHKIGNEVNVKDIEEIEFTKCGSDYSRNISLSFSNENYLAIHTRQVYQLTTGCDLFLATMPQGKLIEKEKDILKYAVQKNTPILIKEITSNYDLILNFLSIDETPEHHTLNQAIKQNSPILIMRKIHFTIKFSIYACREDNMKWGYYDIDSEFANNHNLEQLPFQKGILKQSDPLFTKALKDGLQKYHAEYLTFKIYGSPTGAGWKFYQVDKCLAKSIKLENLPYNGILKRSDPLFTPALIQILMQAHSNANDITRREEENSLYIWDVRDVNQCNRLKKVNFNQLNYFLFDNGILFTAEGNKLIIKDFSPPDVNKQMNLEPNKTLSTVQLS